MKRLFLLSILLSCTLITCDLKPTVIDYNHDECAFCKMKISDVKFGAELVTKKGKIYKYDSAECLIRTYIENENPDYAFVMVTDYAKPNTLIDAATATFLISENQPSPMGGNLSAYEHKNRATLALEKKRGKLLNFEELLNEYRVTYQ